MVKDVPVEVLIQRLQEFVKLWQKYMEYFEYGLETEEITAEDEVEFRKILIEITKKAQFLTLAVPDGIFDCWKDAKKILLETPTLYILKREVPIRISSFKTDWHDVSIALNQKHGLIRSAVEEKDSKKKRKKK